MLQHVLQSIGLTIVNAPSDVNAPGRGRGIRQVDR
jgi:hypothetical protein